MAGEGRVVGEDALAVAQRPAAKGENLHGGHEHRQGVEGRTQRRLVDERARARHEGDRAHGGRGAESYRQAEASPGRGGDAEHRAAGSRGRSGSAPTTCSQVRPDRVAQAHRGTAGLEEPATGQDKGAVDPRDHAEAMGDDDDGATPRATDRASRPARPPDRRRGAPSARRAGRSESRAAPHVRWRRAGARRCSGSVPPLRQGCRARREAGRPVPTSPPARRRRRAPPSWPRGPRGGGCRRSSRGRDRAVAAPRRSAGATHEAGARRAPGRRLGRCRSRAGRSRAGRRAAWTCRHRSPRSPPRVRRRRDRDPDRRGWARPVRGR